MHQPEKEQSNSVVRYRKYIMTLTSYAKKKKEWIKYKHLALQLQGTLMQRSRKGMD